jgi:hypothetical protein
MKKILVIGVCLILVTAVTALAGKPVKPPPVDYEALIDAETDARIAADADLQTQITAEETARIDGDTALQTQIDSVNTNLTPHASVMYLREYYAPPQDCPESWTQANYSTVKSGGGINWVRVCYNMDNSCSVMYLEEPDLTLPVNCPELWTEAGLNRVHAGHTDLNTVRTCYYCAQ